MFNNKNIKFFLRSSSKKAKNQTIDDSYRKAVESKKIELKVELDEEIEKIQQPTQQDIEGANKRIQQLNKRIRDCNSILEKLAKSKEDEKVVSQTDKVQNRQETPITLEQAIREKKLKPLQLQSKTEETTPAAINKVDHDPKKFAVDVNILSRVKLKSVQPRDVISNNENRINPKLAEKFTEQIALLDKSNPTNIEHTKKSEQKFINPATQEVQLEQKNTDNIAASKQTQNSQDNFSLLQNLQNAINNLKKTGATKEVNNLPTWVKLEYLDDLNQKNFYKK